MSGGHFNYDQYRIANIAEEIETIIERNDDTKLNEWGDRIGRGYDVDVIARFREAVHALSIAHIYAQRIDWLLSGDDGPEQFLKRLRDDLSNDGIIRMYAKTAMDMLDNPPAPNDALKDLLELI